MDWQIFGHQSVKNILEKQINSAVFPHAYLFSGPEGVGKKGVALEFAQQVLNTKNLQNHPDFQILDTDGEIKIEQVLDFMGKLGYKPFLGAKKIAIINNAQNLNTQSGNALLKTLEEPSGSSVIILIAGPGKVLPTIVSRCQGLNFNLTGKTELSKFIGANNLEASEAMLDLSFGRIGRLKKFIENKSFFEQESNAVDEYRKIKKQSLGEKLSNIGNFAELEEGELENNLLTWFFWQSEHLTEQPEEFFKVRALADAFLSLRKNYNKKLVLQGLFTKI